MPDPEDIIQQQTLLETHRRTMEVYLMQLGRLTLAYAPPGVTHGIREAQEQIKHCKAALREWGVAVEDKPTDEPLSAEMISQQASAGLAAVAALMHTPDVRTHVATFQESFESALAQLDLLSTYKELHDLLHDLQFKCYRPISSRANDFPGNDLVIESLTYQEADLQEIVNSLLEIAERPNFPRQERSWILQIEQAGVLLRTALEEVSKRQFDRATFEIARVLRIHPTRINEQLKNAARDLPLERLIKAMKAIHEHIQRSTNDDARLGEVSQGIGALEQINERLVQLIQDHDTWQRFDADLQNFEDQLDQRLQELEWLWPDLKPAIAGLCEARSDRWSKDLLAATEKLDQALAAQVAGTMTNTFHTFYSRFSLCFFRADKELKDQCLKLRLVDGPLRSVIGMLG